MIVEAFRTSDFDIGFEVFSPLFLVPGGGDIIVLDTVPHNSRAEVHPILAGQFNYQPNTPTTTSSA